MRIPGNIRIATSPAHSSYLPMSKSTEFVDDATERGILRHEMLSQRARWLELLNPARFRCGPHELKREYPFTTVLGY